MPKPRLMNSSCSISAAAGLPGSDDRCRAVNAAAPDIVWVGLGTPKQERCMHDHLRRLHAPVMVGVGAAFDFHAGVKRQAPPWLQRSGLEWAFRLGGEPGRRGAPQLV